MKKLWQVGGMCAGKGGNLLIHSLNKFKSLAICKKCKIISEVTQTFEETKLARCKEIGPNSFQ